MRNATYFARECLTCGRTLQVRVEYLGKRVACPHCHAILTATDPQLSGQPKTLMNRVEHLLSLNDSAIRAAQERETAT